MARHAITLDTPLRISTARQWLERAVVLGWRGYDSHNESGVLVYDGPEGATNATSGPNRNGSYEDHVMAKKPLPSPEVLRQLLRYEPDTGKLFWKERNRQWFRPGNTSVDANCASWNKRMAGKEAFTAVASNGYRCGAISNMNFLAHRVVWAMQTGEWPADLVDHANGVKTDNRWINLRAATKSQNSQNILARADNKLGVVGVFRRGNVFRAEITASGVRVDLGHFPTVEEAASAYSEAKARLHTHHRTQT